MKVVAFVPIKLNSERLPNKNILPLGDVPLCHHMLETLLKVKAIEDVYVFCSDETVINYLPKGVHFLKRDSALDDNLVKGATIYKSFIEMIEADIYVLAHVTSPFINATSVESALDKVMSGKYDSAFSVKKELGMIWYKDKPLNFDLNDIPRTQDIEPIFIETGAFFIFQRDLFSIHKRRVGFKPYMAVTDLIESVDIDYPEDYELAKAIHKMKVGG